MTVGQRAKATGRMSGAQTVRVLMDAGAVTWSASSQSLPGSRDLKEIELLQREEPWLGSVTFFTNGEVLTFDSLVIEGELNPAWVDAELRSQAEVELKKVEPAYPF